MDCSPFCYGLVKLIQLSKSWTSVYMFCMFLVHEEKWWLEIAKIDVDLKCLKEEASSSGLSTDRQKARYVKPFGELYSKVNCSVRCDIKPKTVRNIISMFQTTTNQSTLKTKLQSIWMSMLTKLHAYLMYPTTKFHKICMSMTIKFH